MGKITDIENTVVKNLKTGTQFLIKNIGTVQYGRKNHQIRAMTYNGKEVAGAVVMMMKRKLDRGH